MTEEEKNREASKDGCEYALDLSKQFITFSAAGLAFLLGLAAAETTRPPFLVTLLVLILFALSVAAGLLFHMKVTGNVADQQIPRAVVPELDNVIRNLELLVNESKSSTVGDDNGF
jgi:hypothetical protein